MFVRVKTTPNSPKKAVQIVENIRVGNKVKQRIIRHIGVALTDEELERLKDLGEFIKASLEKSNLFSPHDMAQIYIHARKKKEEDKQSLTVDLKNLREEKRIVVGIHDVYGELYRELGFDTVIPARKGTIKDKLFHIVMARIANPKSKMATVNDLEENFGINISLPSVYRMMDAIDEKAENNIQKKAWQSVNTLFSYPVNVVFYDCTTLYFESYTEDELKDYGYSKDLKFNQVQILLAVLVTDSGLPIGYEVYNGSTYEGHTLKDAVERLEKQYKIKDVTFVADSAMLSRKNVELIEDMGKHYILGARLKNLPEDIKEKILEKDTFIPVDKEGYLVKEIPYKNKRLIVTFSPACAKKDAHDRQRAIEKLLTKIEKGNIKQFMTNYGYKRFVKIKTPTEIELDREKIEEDSKWDGIHGIITNNHTLTPLEIVEHYHRLYQVEDTFRITKHDLKVRPVFHWTPKRIRAHIAICFMALTLIRHLQYRMKILGKPLSSEKIRQALISAQLSIVRDIKTDHLYGIPSATKSEVKELYKAVGVKLTDIPYQIK